MSVSLRRRYTPVLDQLEHRNLLAGNVLAAMDHGVLNIYGDADTNQISIVSDAKHNLTVTSLDDTTINGLDNSVTFKNVQGLTVFLRKGMMCSTSPGRRSSSLSTSSWGRITTRCRLPM